MSRRAATAAAGLAVLAGLVACSRQPPSPVQGPPDTAGAEQPDALGDDAADTTGAPVVFDVASAPDIVALADTGPLTDTAPVVDTSSADSAETADGKADAEDVPPLDCPDPPMDTAAFAKAKDAGPDPWCSKEPALHAAGLAMLATFTDEPGHFKYNWAEKDIKPFHFAADPKHEYHKQVAAAQAEAHPLPWAATAATRLPPVTVTIPKGPVWVGCNPKTEAWCAGDAPVQQHVTLDTFEIAVFETTVAQFYACSMDGVCKSKHDEWVGYDGCENPDTWDFCSSFSNLIKQRWLHPANMVRWQDARAFCLWLGPGWDLPTQAQWEKAARGGCEKWPGQCCKTAMPAHPWGKWDSVAGWAGCADFGDCCETCPYFTACDPEPWVPGWTHPVGRYPATVSPYGVHDMTTNLTEYVRDVLPWQPWSDGSQAVNPLRTGGASPKPLKNFMLYGNGGFQSIKWPAHYVAKQDEFHSIATGRTPDFDPPPPQQLLQLYGKTVRRPRVEPFFGFRCVRNLKK